MHDSASHAAPDPMRDAIATQFQSALAMLRRAIEICPEQLWLEGTPNRFWHIAFHALFYTHFYLAPSNAEFAPWEKHRQDHNFLGEVPRRPGESRPAEPRRKPYTQADLLEYAGLCRDEIATRLATVDLVAPSGFYWLPFDKGTLQLYNLRHLAHHTGQLTDRLRTQAGIGLPWVGR